MASFIPENQLNGEVSDQEIAYGDADGEITSSSNLVFTGSDVRNKHVSGSFTANQVISGYGSGPGVFRPYNSNDYSELWGYDTSSDVLKLQVGRNNEDDANYRQAVIRAPLTIDMSSGDNADIAAPSDGNARAYLNNVGLQVISRQTGSGVGPRLVLWKDGDNGVDGEEIGEIVFVGPAAGTSTDFDYARIHTEIAENQQGSLDGRLKFLVRNDNTNREVLTVGPNNVTMNGQGAADLLILRTADGALADGPDLVMDRNTIGVNGQFLGRLNWRGRNDANGGEDYAVVRAYIADATDGSEDGLLQFMVTKNGTMTEGFRVASGAVEVNSTQNSSINFKVKTSQNANALLVDGSSGDITFNGQYGELLRMDSSASTVELYKLVLKDSVSGTTSSIYDTGYWLKLDAQSSMELRAGGSALAWVLESSGGGFTSKTRMNNVSIASANFITPSNMNESGTCHVVADANATYEVIFGNGSPGHHIQVYNDDASNNLTIKPNVGGTLNGGSSISLAPQKLGSFLCVKANTWVTA